MATDRQSLHRKLETMAKCLSISSSTRATTVWRLPMFEAQKTSVHMLCGDYDLTCTPADATRTASATKGATIVMMDELGHFPMSENSNAYRPCFADALAPMP